MATLVTLAWRNIWRNKRRTLITAGSVFFAVFFSVIQRGFHKGSWVKMIENIVHSYTGYIQVHDSGYWDNRTFDYSLEYTRGLNSTVKHTPGVRTVMILSQKSV